MNQIPNIEETHNTREIEEIFREYEWLAESTGNPTMHIGGERLQNLKNDIKAHIHHQLQKARQDWLQEEIVRLEGMKIKQVLLPKEWKEKNPNGDWFEMLKTKTAYNEALQTIIDRYQAELDQAELLNSVKEDWDKQAKNAMNGLDQDVSK